MSRPIVAIVCMGSSSESWEPQQTPTSWHSRAGRSRPQHQQETYAVQQVPALFDDLVGAREHRRRQAEVERLCSFQIDHQLVLGRRLDRHVTWLLALEDAIDITGGSPILLGE